MWVCLIVGCERVSRKGYSFDDSRRAAEVVLVLSATPSWKACTGGETAWSLDTLSSLRTTSPEEGWRGRKCDGQKSNTGTSRPQNAQVEICLCTSSFNSGNLPLCSEIFATVGQYTRRATSPSGGVLRDGSILSRSPECARVRLDQVFLRSTPILYYERAHDGNKSVYRRAQGGVSKYSSHG